MARRHASVPDPPGLALSGSDGVLIRLRGVDKVYETGALKFRALKEIDLEMGRGEFVGLIGKSGSGKTTLVNMVTGIDRPTRGEVIIGGTLVHTLSENQMAIWRGKALGVVFQFFQLLPTLTVAENVMLPMDFGGLWTPKEREERAMALLEQVEMVDQARKLPSATSGGQQQRVAIARALANDPPILVADEPTGNLDSSTAEAVIRLFDELVGAGKTIVMVTHDREIASHARRTVHMVDGDLVDGTLPDEEVLPAAAAAIGVRGPGATAGDPLAGQSTPAAVTRA
jgi:putative ABC transport system ATP-binding protein